jgi:hypothetical protein
MNGPSTGACVRHGEPTIGDVAGQRLPTRPGIADRLGERTLAAHPVERRVEERLQLFQQRSGVLFARGDTLLGWSADAAFDGEQSGDPLQGLQGDRRGCGMVHVVELAACVAPACNLDQRRLAVGRGWPVEPFEPGIPVGMQKAPAGAKQCLRMAALSSDRMPPMAPPSPRTARRARRPRAVRFWSCPGRARAPGRWCPPGQAP